MKEMSALCSLTILTLVASTCSAFSSAPRIFDLRSRLPNLNLARQSAIIGIKKISAEPKMMATSENVKNFLQLHHRQISAISLSSLLAASMFTMAPVNAVNEGSASQATSPELRVPSSSKQAARGNFELPNIGGIRISDDLTKDLEKFPGDVAKQLESIKVETQSFSLL